MRAGTMVEFDAYGDVDVLHFTPQPVPRPNRDEVVVEVVAAALNHMDLYVRAGAFADAVPLTFPATQGSCFAGIVRARGADVHGLAKGVAVVGHDPAHAAHASYVVVPANAVVPKPEPVSWEVAGGLYLAGTTAWSVVESLRLTRDDVVLVSAAAGGVGHLECQLAHNTGAIVIGIAGRENHDYLRSIGVLPVAYGDDLVADIRTAAKGRPVTAFIDNYGRYDALAAELEVPPSRFSSTDDRRDTEIRFYRASGDDPEPARIMTHLLELVQAWKLRMLISGFYGFEHIAQAVGDLDARHSRGKVIVGMHTSAPPASYLQDKLRSHHEKVGRAVAVADAAAAAALVAEAEATSTGQVPSVDPAA